MNTYKSMCMGGGGVCCTDWIEIDENVILCCTNLILKRNDDFSGNLI